MKIPTGAKDELNERIRYYRQQAKEYALEALLGRKFDTVKSEAWQRLEILAIEKNNIASGIQEALDVITIAPSEPNEKKTRICATP